MMRKGLSLLLACLLLGQSGVGFAQTNSVLQSRDRARQAVENTSDVAEIGVIVGGLVAAPVSVYIWQRYRYSKIRARDIALRKENKKLTTENKVLLEELQRKEQRIKHLTNKATGLQTQNGILHERIVESRNTARQLQEGLDDALAKLAKSKEEIFAYETMLAEKINAKEYAALAGKSAEELQQILPKMIARDFKGISKLQAESLLDMLTEILGARAAGLSHFYSKAPFQLSILLRNLAKEFGLISYFTIFGILLATSAVMVGENIDRQVVRLQTNPSLLLTLTDEQAVQLDKSPIARELCGLIAQAYEEVVSYPEEKRAALAHEISSIPQVSVQQLAR